MPDLTTMQREERLRRATTHTDDCAATTLGDECEAIEGWWMQPDGTSVSEAEEILGDEAPWCQVRLLAWELGE